MPRSPRLSVIIPHLNQPTFLQRCLRSLAEQTGDVPPHEIFVVDNGSRALPLDIVDAFENVMLLEEPEPGPGPARNRGVAQASGEILAFIDSDCLAHPGWLARIASVFDSDPEKGILGGDVFIARKSDDQATPLEAYESVYAYRMKEYIAKQGFTGTGNLAVRKSIMDKVGRFGGIGIAEDRDWGQRATAMGHATSYVADMVVYHPARETFDELKVKWNRHIAHDFTRMREKSGWWWRWVGRAVAVALSPGPEVLRILRSPRINGIRERALAFLVLIRIRLYRAWTMLSLVMGRSAEAMSGSWNRD